jgi:hypothetical protein
LKNHFFVTAFFFVLASGFNSIKLFAADYFWVKGNNPTSSGNWSDLTHWANTSGGSGAAYAAVPTSGDHVYFDANSFSATGETVTIDQTQVSCDNISWTGVTFNPTFLCLSGRSLNVYGSFTLDAGMTLNFSGVLNFEARTSGKTITTAGKSFGGAIHFNGPGGSWTLQDAIRTTSDVFLNNGTLNTNNQSLDARLFNSNNSNVRSLIMGASVFNLTYALWFWEVSNSANLSLDAGTSTINGNVGQAGFSQSFRGGNLTYYNLNFNSTLNTGGTIDGNNSFHNVTFANHGNISGNNTFNDLSFSPGYTYILGGGKTQTINGNFSATGTCNSRITIKSGSSNSSGLSHPSGILALNFLYLNNIAVTPANSTAGNSIDLGGSTGWIITPPAARNLYWVGDSGNWSDGNHWSAVSGGPADGCPPTLLDHVFFDQNSFSLAGQSVTLDKPTSYCKNINWIGMNQNATFVSANTLYVYGSLTFVPGMQLNFTGPLYFEASSPGQTVTSAGKTFGNNIIFNGVGGGWTLQDALSTNSDVLLNHGTLNSNDQTLNARSFNSNNTNLRTLNMGASVFNLSYALWFWEVSNSSNMTLIPGTSTINGIIGQAGFSQSFRGGNLSYYNLNFNSLINTGGTIDGNNTFNNVSFLNHGFITGNNTFSNLLFSPGYTYTLTSSKVQTILGTLTANGTCTNNIMIKSSAAGSTSIQKTSGTVVVTSVSLTGIHATGGASFTANNSVDGGNNSGWTINVSASNNLYWIGDGGNWSDGNHWSTSSGGSPFGCAPGIGDDVFFDENSFSASGQTVTVDVPTANCRSMTWTGVGNNPTFSCVVANTMKIYGSLTMAAGMNLNFSGPLYFESGSIGNTIRTFGKPFNGAIHFNGIGGSWILQDTLTTLSDVVLINGTLNTNNQTLNARLFNSNNANIRSLVMGASVFNLSYALWFWETSNANNFTLDAGTSTINGITGQAGFSQSFRGGSLNYHNLNFKASTNTGGILDGNNSFNKVSFSNHGNITGNNSFKDLTFAPGFTYTLTSGKTQTIIDNLNISGTGGFPIKIQSSANGTQSTFYKASGSVCVDYIRISDNQATGGASFNTGNNSQDLGGNTGWNFNAGGPAPDLNILASDTGLVCSGTSVTFTAVTNSSGTNSFQWFVNGVLVQTGNSSVYINNELEDGDTVSCKLSVEGSGGCSLSGLAEARVGMHVNEQYEAGTISTTADSICKQGATKLNLQGYSSDNIQWYSRSSSQDSFSLIDGANAPEYLTPSLNETTYFYAVVGSGPCADTTLVYAVTVLDVTPVAGFTQVVDGLSVNFTSSSTGATSYQWNFGDGNTSTQTNPSHTYDGSGTYNVCLVAYNGPDCSSTFCNAVNAGVNGIYSISGNKQFLIYPNPASELVNIRGESLNEIESIVLYDALGRTIIRQNLRGHSTAEVQLNLTGITEGIYHIKLSGKTFEKVVNLLKVK